MPEGQLYIKQLQDNLDLQAPKSLDERTHAWDDSNRRDSGYTNVAAALIAVPLGKRYVGMSLWIGTQLEYWFNNGTADSDLVLKKGFYRYAEFNSNDTFTMPVKSLLTTIMVRSATNEVIYVGTTSSGSNVASGIPLTAGEYHTIHLSYYSEPGTLIYISGQVSSLIVKAYIQ